LFSAAVWQINKKIRFFCLSPIGESRVIAYIWQADAFGIISFTHQH